MPLAISLFPDIDGLDGLIEDSSTFLCVWILAMAVLLAFVVVDECVDRFKRRSPVEKMLRKRFG